MSSLAVRSVMADHLARLIAETGPIPVARYMEEVLGHPSLGYYVRKDPFGADGDFTTAPEISQMFGELVGLWCAEVWRMMGAPDPVLLVELGPGRGTLMADLLRAARIVPAFAAAVRVHLVETSPHLRSLQRERIEEPCIWHAGFDGVPPGPALLVANEFFDALPVRQFVRAEYGWRERLVDRTPDGTGFRFVLAQEHLNDQALLPAPLRDAPLSALVEAAPDRARLARAIGERLAAQGGAALIVDYGHVRSAPGDTFQAVRSHAYADPLAEPGEADLTAHVDFEALADAARDGGAAISGPVEQGRFLHRLGIVQRAERLAAASPGRKTALALALRRLTASDQMGALFKVLAVRDPRLPNLPGFDAA